MSIPHTRACCLLPAVVAVSLLPAAVGVAYPSGDFQVWNTDTIEMKALPALKVAAEAEFRRGDDAMEFFYQHYDGGILWTASPLLSMGAGYRHVMERKNGDFRSEFEPYATLTLSASLLGATFETRSRQEFRHFTWAADSWRYRNRTAVKFPLRPQALPCGRDPCRIRDGSVPAGPEPDQSWLRLPHPRPAVGRALLHAGEHEKRDEMAARPRIGD